MGDTLERDMKMMIKRTLVLHPLALAVTLAIASQVHAVGEGVIGSGSGSISKNGAVTTVTQNTSKMIVNWDNMDVAKGETLNFDQRNSTVAALNRVHSIDPTSILGALNARGRVFVVNPNGVLIGNGATINVGSLVASSLNISDDDFKAREFHFAGDGTGKVVNEGVIKARESVALFSAGEVNNMGEIHAQGGTSMAAGSDITFHLPHPYQDSLLAKVNKGSVEALVKNGGLIVAPSGSVQLTAWGTDALTRSVINNTGTIEAASVEVWGDVLGGSVVLASVGNGAVDVGGRITSERITASGDAVNVTKGELKATGAGYGAAAIDLNARAKDGYVKFGDTALTAKSIRIVADNVLTDSADYVPTFTHSKPSSWGEKALKIKSASSGHNFSVGDDVSKADYGLINAGIVKAAANSNFDLLSVEASGKLAVNNNGNLHYGNLLLRNGSGNVELNSAVKGKSLTVLTKGMIEQAVGADVTMDRSVTMRADQGLMQKANISGQQVELNGGKGIVQDVGTQTRADDVSYRGDMLTLNGDMDASILTLRGIAATQGTDSSIKTNKLRLYQGAFDLSTGKNDVALISLYAQSANVATTGDTTLSGFVGDLKVHSDKRVTLGNDLMAYGKVKVSVGREGEIYLGQNFLDYSWENFSFQGPMFFY